MMPLFKHLWVVMCICVPNFRIIPEKEFILLTPIVGILEIKKSAVRSMSSENVRNKNGCVVSSTGKVDLSFGFNDTI